MSARGGALRRPEQLTGRAIQRQVLSEALQHPLTLFPFAGGVVAGTYAVFFAPFLGGGIYALLAAGACGASALASFGWHYLVQGERSAVEKARRVLAEEEARRRGLEEGQLAEGQSELEEGFTALAHPQGLAAVRELAGEYQRLQRELNDQDQLLELSKRRLSAAAAGVYRQGLTALSEALGLMRAVQATDRERLVAEVHELEASVKAGDSELLPLKQQTLQSLRESVQLVDRQRAEAEQALDRAQLARAALLRVRLALPSVGSRMSDQDAYELAADLERAIKATDRPEPRIPASRPQEQAVDDAERVRG